MTDLDVPKDLSLINKPGVQIALDAPRMPFIHWVLIDIPPSMIHLDKGIESMGYAPGPRPTGPTDHGVRGANVYSGFFPKGTPLAGPRGGYDGPCPPQNDPKPHRYLTQVYALDVTSLGLSGVFFGEAVEKRLEGHVLAQGSAEALYGPSTAP
jgi:Raf kinase inhibitor-like YbhB/YbcL family protein